MRRLITYRAISLWEPWASLVILGAKHYETRHWPTNFRGLVVIHAAKRWSLEQRRYFNKPIVQAVLHGMSESDLPFGKALGIVNWGECYKTEKIRDRLSEQELAFGDYSDDRFASALSVVELFDPPIPYVGQQGFFPFIYPGRE